MSKLKVLEIAQEYGKPSEELLGQVQKLVEDTKRTLSTVKGREQVKIQEMRAKEAEAKERALQAEMDSEEAPQADAAASSLEHADEMPVASVVETEPTEAEKTEPEAPAAEASQKEKIESEKSQTEAAEPVKQEPTAPARPKPQMGGGPFIPHPQSNRPAQQSRPAQQARPQPPRDNRPVRPQQPAIMAPRTPRKPVAPGFAAAPAPAKNFTSPPPKPRYDDRKNRSRKPLPDKKNAPMFDDERYRGRKPKRRQQPAQTIVPIKIEKAVITTEMVSVKDLSEKIGKPAAEIIKKLFLLGILATINQEIDFDTAALVASEYDIELEHKMDKTFEEVLTDEDHEDDSKDLENRPPVVTIMGHVDHGKTSLLDVIRSTHVTDQESGGITQHIGAYMVNVHDQAITFLDTPGHEAFTAMRARGAQVTDIAILVVAADDGVMPQTIEAINHSKAAEVPIIVAINKIDKPGANPDKVMQELTEYGLVAEDWGGDTIMVPVSAHTKEGLDKLLEMVLLVAEMQELRANANRMAKGSIIEAKLDKGRGPVATVLVQNGTLKVGDTIVAGTAYGRVRAMLNDKGRRVDEAGPSVPVEVLGFSEVPEAGDVLYAVEDDKLSRQVAEERRNKQKIQQMKVMSKVSLDELFSQIAQGQVKDLNIVVKADVQGSVEAMRQSLEKLSNDEVRVRVIHGGVGAIAETDVMLASVSNAIIIGFHVRPDAKAREAAEKENVDLRLYRVIYEAIDDVEKAMKGMLEPVYREVVLGHAQVREVFKVSGVGVVAGSYITDGKIVRNAEVRVLRDNVVVHEGKIDSLKRFKDDAKEVMQGYECGIGLENFNDIKEGDVLEAFTQEEVER